MWVVKIKRKKKKESKPRKTSTFALGKNRARGNKVYVTVLLGSLSSSFYDLFGSFKNILKR